MTIDAGICRCQSCGGWMYRANGCQLCARDTTLIPRKRKANQ